MKIVVLVLLLVAVIVFAMCFLDKMFAEKVDSLFEDWRM